MKMRLFVWAEAWRLMSLWFTLLVHPFNDIEQHNCVADDNSNPADNTGEGYEAEQYPIT